MKKGDATLMSPAEWEIMRIIWTKKGSSSKEVISLMQLKRNWSESTIKTLLGRLVEKKMLQTNKEGRRFFYQPTITESDAMNKVVSELFDHLCNMKKGSVILNLLSSLTFSREDIKKMQSLLSEKMETAPASITCDCLPHMENCSMHEKNC
ncbi:transcriptional regulator [Liquorilactobacillus aquaticus DSM 21051]|uniref:Transcriptional regulator n=1 Tax=Liquorilactobacillus aquaticus DSM 21051 TaxID=1423725 RepID=A0A0R2CTW6_9LACO|nr:CopY/TcrY family copper transport repressor [Liquorilactobacillus aquaticus]KRM94853.1 transcriptional regulator [Liquorilactobacillus aquaticus DSM 21051]